MDLNQALMEVVVLTTVQRGIKRLVAADWHDNMRSDCGRLLGRWSIYPTDFEKGESVSTISARKEHVDWMPMNVSAQCTKMTMLGTRISDHRIVVTTMKVDAKRAITPMS